MRIVLVGTAFPMRGGIAHYVALLYQKLRDRGHYVRVLAFRRQYPSLLFPGKTQLNVSHDPVKSTPSRQMIDSVNPVTWWKAVRWMLQPARRPDLVVFVWWNPFFGVCYGVMARLLRRHAAIPGTDARPEQRAYRPYGSRSAEPPAGLATRIRENLRAFFAFARQTARTSAGRTRIRADERVLAPLGTLLKRQTAWGRFGGTAPSHGRPPQELPLRLACESRGRLSIQRGFCPAGARPGRGGRRGCLPLPRAAADTARLRQGVSGWSRCS